AKSSVPSATSTSVPGSSHMPSTATDVPTTGTPLPRLSPTLPLTPAPNRSGAIVTRAPAYNGSRSCTQPWTQTPGPSSARTSSVGLLPTTCSTASGCSFRTSGMISRAAQQAASTFGGWSKPPTNSTSSRPSGCAEPSSTWCTLDSTRTSASGTSSRSSCCSASDTTKVTSQE